jgi:hypothetical protein
VKHPIDVHHGKPEVIADLVLRERQTERMVAGEAMRRSIGCRSGPSDLRSMTICSPPIQD